jgi:hypothetical protein
MKKCFNQLSLSRGSQGGQFMLDCTLKDVTLAILMESEQRMIIKFLFNEGADAHQIAERLRAQFHEDAYALPNLYRNTKRSMPLLSKFIQDRYDAMASAFRVVSRTIRTNDPSSIGFPLKGKEVVVGFDDAMKRVRNQTLPNRFFFPSGSLSVR